MKDSKSQFLLVIMGILIILAFLPFSFFQIASALTGNYNKASGDQLTIADWNNLDNDFLDKQNPAGDSMAGPLTLPSNPTQNLQAATKQYVDSNSGGSVFVNWGRGDCPSGTIALYSGYGFGSKYNLNGGGTEPICVANPANGSNVKISYADDIYPLGIGTVSNYLPTALQPFATKEVKCALCLKIGGVCYENWGRQSCPPSFTPVYQGYALGGPTVTSGYVIENNRKCVNSNFDNTSPINNNYGAVWYGTALNRDGDLAGNNYTDRLFLECAICCN